MVPTSFGGELSWDLLRVIAVVLSVTFLLSLRIAALAPSTLSAVLTTFTAALAGLVPLQISLGNLGDVLRPLSDYELQRGTLLWRVGTTMTPFGFPLPILLAIATVVLVVASLLWKASSDFGRVRPRSTAVMVGISCALLPILVGVAVGLCNLAIDRASVVQQTTYFLFNTQFAPVVTNLEAGNPQPNTNASQRYTLEQIRVAGTKDPWVINRFINPGQTITIHTMRAGNKPTYFPGPGRRIAIPAQPALSKSSSSPPWS